LESHCIACLFLLVLTRMSAKKRPTDPTPSSTKPEPPGLLRTITFTRFLSDFATKHRAAREGRGARFCFILGAGASFESGIPMAGTLVDDWLRELHSFSETKLSLPQWATAKTLEIPNFTWENRASSYGLIFRRRFMEDADRGQGWLERVMEAAEPSWGYNILAQLLDTHPIVVTTNFDNLIAEAIHLAGGRAPLSIVHEQLAHQIPPHPRRPVIVKIHRDLFFDPKNDESSIGVLAEDWKQPLQRIFTEYIPVFIGYGGHDGSLMTFLNALPEGIPQSAYWLTMPDKSDPPKPLLPEISDFLQRKYCFLVHHTGFDLTMRKLQQELSLEEPQRLMETQHTKRLSKLREQETGLNEAVNQHIEDLKATTGPLSEETIQAEADAIDLLINQGKLHEAAAKLQQVQQDLAAQPATPDTRSRLLLDHVAGRLMLEKKDGTASYPHHENLLARCRTVLGDEDPLTLQCWSRLGLALYFLGKFSEAETEFRAALLVMQRVLGPEDRVTLATRTNLASAYDEQKKYAAAETEERSVLEISPRALGPEHRNTLTSRNNLANYLIKQGKHPEAEAESRSLLALSQRVLGPEHPDTLSYQYNLALTLNEQGNTQEARQHAEEAYQGRKCLFGENNPDTIDSKNLLDSIQLKKLVKIQRHYHKHEK
jgi:tetratricopeptide (TPR) repeat protein